MDKEKKLVSKFNFIMGLLHGIFYSGGIAFGSSTTILDAKLKLVEKNVRTAPLVD